MHLSFPPTDWPTKTFHLDQKVTIPNESVIELHSLLNLVNIISLVLQNWEMDNSPNESSRLLLEHNIPSLKEWIKFHKVLSPGIVADLCMDIQRSFLSFVQQSPDQTMDQDTKDLLNDLSLNLGTQIKDLKQMERCPPGSWLETPTNQIEHRLFTFLQAIERNSKGRFQILFQRTSAPQATHNPSISYAITLSFMGISNGRIKIPSRFLSTLQDLVANARKYAPMGGTITAQIKQTSDHFIFSILDNGTGIQANEIEKVIQYGYRGSQHKNVTSYGGGYGLTKALYLCQRHGGTMKIASKTGEGMWIQLKLPFYPKTTES